VASGESALRSSVPVIIAITAWALAAGCSRKDPDVPSATQAFQRRYPEYVIRSSTVVETQEMRKVVAVEFDAPKDAKNRGRAELLMEKGTNGSWDIVAEKVHMWKP
jgi:hypothetical protein